ncbi:extracellular solute-binding protein [Labedella phragmitis]|uniref:Extracellular solute-binding protein n=1 Tax=Labedella phragmitis TaxID=2498849 RepID=A0A3S4BBN0_9MICO|nr:extracellular solute-binding protein [Labedella phragmitis]RWZ46303.1 extracellular solute-binding protein [Labedella phragmitis]
MIRTRRAPLAAAIGITTVVLLAGCAPGSGQRTGPTETEEITEPVTVEQVAELGDVTLRVWADAGEESMLDALVEQYEDTYDNVTVDVTIKGWDDLMGTVVNAMNGDNAPDVTNGNQGFAIMGTMVKGGMLRPIDDVIAAYGIDEGLPESGFDSMRWNDDGTQWGSGNIYGMGGATQPLGLFYNRAKLEELGLGVPDSIGEVEEALATAKAGGETPIQLGNSDQYPLGSHVLGILINMYADPAEVNEWIAGGADASFDSPGIRAALEKLAEWGEKGYFAAGYDGRSLDDAVSAYGEGDGVFFLGGSFNGSKLAAVDPDAFGYTLLRAESGEYVTTGTFGTPWHISSKSTIQPAAIAFLGMMLSPEFAQTYADSSRLPVADLEGVTATGSMHQSQLDAAQALFADGEFVGYLDWATPTMQRTLGAGAQELLGGRMSVDEFVESVQSDWSDYQTERTG